MVIKLVHHAASVRSDRRGAGVVVMALILPALIGALGLGFEISNWYLTNRSMQNAADSAAIAAASNASSN
jgi:Flp pilus assembly protein TadG